MTEVTPVPEGFREEWVPSSGWKLVDEVEGDRYRCRWGGGGGSRACGRPSVAALNRGRHTWMGRVDQWWHYCAEHLYGRRIENGVVLHRRLVEDER